MKPTGIAKLHPSLYCVIPYQAYRQQALSKIFEVKGKIG